MLARWRTITYRPPVTTSNRYGIGCWKLNTSTIAVKAASIELRDTMREMASTTPQTTAAPIPTGSEIANRTPSPVAADFRL